MAKKGKDTKPQLISAFFEDEMKTSYLNYAYSVITSRAIPDVRDGTKPVHRRILFAMSELALWHDKQTRKSARVVGDVLGKYHPHGDSSVYMAAVKMAQDFNMRYPLIVGQGNFGSIDDDPPAAMRYTEMKLSRVAEFMLDDLKKDTVDFRPNFDDTMQEPSVLPGKFPQLLCNGTAGIAVGFATDLPPHNLTEVSKAVAAYIKNPQISIKDLMKYMPGPDFPTHGIITNKHELLEAYETGNGSVELAGKIEYEEQPTQRSLIITEIPYRIIKSKIVEEISNLALDTKSKYNLILKEIKEVRDESSKEGIRVNIILTKDADAEAIKTIIYKATSMKVKIRMNFVNLVKNQPRVLNLRDMLGHYVEHRRDVIIRRTKYDLDKAEKELHILEGLLIALDNIDEVIRIIKASKDTPTARTNLMKAFKLSEIQSQAILDMRLQKLTNLETNKLIERKNELLKLIKELKAILASEEIRNKIIIDELAEMIKEIGDERRTQFGAIETASIDQEELIKNEEMLLTVSKKGFIIRETGSYLRTGSRTSKGRKGDATDSDRLEQDDYIFATVYGHLKDTVLFVSDAGRVYSLKGYEITGSNDGRITRGHIRNIDRLKSIESNGEKISSVLLIDEFHPDCNLVFITAKGKAPRISLDNFDSIQRVGIIAVKLNKGDTVAGALVTDGKQELFFLKKNGKGFRIKEELLPIYSRGAAGANCVGTSGDAQELVLGMGAAQKDEFVVVITTDGKGKKLTAKDFTLRANRGGKGFKVIDISKKRELADMTVCKAGDNIVITTKAGRRVSYSVDSLSSNLLKMIDLNDDDAVSAISTISGDEPENDDSADV